MTTRDLPHLAGRLFGTPLLIDARKLDAIVPAFMRRLNGDDDDVGDAARATVIEPTIAGGIAVIPVIGTLVRRKTMMDAWSGLTSYHDLAASLDCALDDARVKAILFQVDSFGGEAQGCFELCDRIYAARGRKPIWAIADVDSLSAGYAILSQADQCYVAPSGSAGSIGAVAVHCERSQLNEAMGVTYTLIRSGLRKAELNVYEPLARAAAEKMQASLDKVRKQFVRTVVRARPGLTARAALATEGQWYDAEDALAQKLINGILTYEDAFAALARSVAATVQPEPPPSPPAPAEDDDDEDDIDPPEDELPVAAQEDRMDTQDAPNTGTAQPNVVDLDSVRAEGRAAFAAEVKEIAELCQLAGRPALAAEYIGGGRTVAQVREALIAARAQPDQQMGEISNRQPEQAAALDIDAMWQNSFKKALAWQTGLR
jgi:ClpP class serine protease